MQTAQQPVAFVMLGFKAKLALSANCKQFCFMHSLHLRISLATKLKKTGDWS